MKASRKDLLSFANSVEGAISSAILVDPSNYNSGPLWESLNRGNLRSATVPVKCAPKLDQNFQIRAPFEYGAPLVVDAFHYFDRSSDDFVYWIWPANKVGTFDEQGEAINATTAAWFRGVPDGGYPKFLAGGNFADDVTCDIFLRHTADLFPRDFPEKGAVAEQMEARDALALTILNLRNTPGWIKQTTRALAEKSFPNSATINGFQVKAYTYSEESAVPKHEYTLAAIATELSFSPNSYDGPYDGLLRRKLEVKIQAGEVVEVQKTSKITLLNNPYIDDDGELGTYGNIYDESPVPPELRHLVQDDDEVTPADIEAFIRLATEPVEYEQTEIAP